MAMDWNRFDPHGSDASVAFEALTGLLFERFCHRSYGTALREVRFVEGRGGDGGVEAYAILASGEEIGLQAKWFRGAFGRRQIAQIDGSFRSVIANHSSMVRYVVAIPRKLTDARDKRAERVSGDRRPETTERRCWDDWKSKANVLKPGIEPELWDEATIEGLLTEPANEGLHAYWFTDAVIRQDELAKRFEVDKEHGWLSPRYTPDLHAEGELEEQIALRVGEPWARVKLTREVRRAIDELSEVRDDVARLSNCAVFRGADLEAGARRDAALVALNTLCDLGEELALALRTGRAVGERPAFGPNHEDALRRLHDVLERIAASPGGHRAPTRDIFKRLRRSLWVNQAPLTLLQAWKRWQGTPKIAAFVGPPGIGKTHGLAHAVDRRLAAGEPSLLLRARDCPLDEGWAGILRRALDRPTWNLATSLNALEALAVRAEIAHARSPSAAGAEAGEIDRGPTRLLLAIDGLDENGRHERWAELLGELSAHIGDRPRLRVAVTLRTASKDAILCRAKPASFDTIVLPRWDGDVQSLLKDYCTYYGVQPPDRRLRWALRDPLSVRLYCEVAKREPQWGSRRQNLSLPKLLQEKLAHEERALREKGGWSDHVEPLQTLLTVVTSAYAQQGPLRRDEVLAAAHTALAPRGMLPPERWDWILEWTAEAGLLLCSKGSCEGPDAPTRSYVEPAFEPLTDYLVAKAACEASVQALTRGENPKLDAQLARRPEALVYAAILLAQQGVFLSIANLWTDDMPAEERERIHLSAIAALNDDDARPYADWVRARLVADLASCRRVLAELCVPVARDEAHPFGPKFVHETLLPLLPATRDVFWSGPSYRAGDGGYAEGTFPGALELLTLEPDDRADGPPLLLSWALTSVDTVWRRRLRLELAQWGAGDLDALVRWLNLTVQTNDPQMAEDIAMVAYGAACLAGADPKLSALSAWADANWLAPDARHRREDVLVIHAARGIVERARFMGARVDPIAMEHAKLLYASEPRLLPIDAVAAKEADAHWGVRPITGDLAWYVVPRAIQPFFGLLDLVVTLPHTNPSAWKVVDEHASALELDGLTPQKLAFGAVRAHLDAMGWSGQELALGREYEPETHGARSPVCSLVEKYVWTGCHLLQAYFAARAPAEVSCANGSDTHAEPPVDPSFLSDLVPNPASDADAQDPSAPVSKAFFAADDLAPMLDLNPGDQADMANDWVRRAPSPDLQRWLEVSSTALPSWASGSEWIVLGCVATATERHSQADSILRVSSFIVPLGHEPVLRREGHRLFTSARRDLAEFGEVVRCGTYADPFDSAWAPWPTGSSATDHLGKGLSERIDIEPAIAGLTWQRGQGEAPVQLPAEWLRRALDLAGMERHSREMHREYRFVDRRGEVQAVYVEEGTGRERHEALVVRATALRRALVAKERALVWSAWLFRWPNPQLFDEERQGTTPFTERHREWLAFLTPRGIDVQDLPPYQPILGEPPPEDRSDVSPSPVIPVGPTNPGLATKLELALDDEEAIPYFLWDDPMTVRELRAYLASASPPERDRTLGKILREARDPDVWRFTTPGEVAARFDVLSPHLGRRRAFWRFLLDCWEKERLLVKESA